MKHWQRALLMVAGIAAVCATLSMPDSALKIAILIAVPLLLGRAAFTLGADRTYLIWFVNWYGLIALLLFAAAVLWVFLLARRVPDTSTGAVLLFGPSICLIAIGGFCVAKALYRFSFGGKR